MERVKRMFQKLFCLPPLATVLIALPSFLFVFCVLGMGIDGVAAYASYGLSAYALVITVTGVVRIVRAVRGGIDQHPLVAKVREHPLGGRYLTDAAFRTECSLYQGLFISLLYIGMKLVSGIYYRSAWFIALSIYYFLLALMRFLLLRHVKRTRIGVDLTAEWRRYRLCGIVLLLLNQALVGIVAFIVYQNRGYDYPGVLIYAMAAYTFYITITAIIQLVKFRKWGSPILSAAKAINLVAALVSMLSLTTAMLARFSVNEDPSYRPIMTGAVGGGVCLIVLGMAVLMIIRSTRQVKKPSQHKLAGGNKS